MLLLQVVALCPIHITFMNSASTHDTDCNPPSAGQFAENETNEVNFREIPSHVLSKVCMYFTYKVRYTNSSTEIPEFPIAPEIALELLMAANFLDC